jgi:hypothetical protein
MMKDSSSKSSSFAEFQEFIEDGSLIINHAPSDKDVDIKDLEERRMEMLKDNIIQKAYSKNKKLSHTDENAEEINPYSYSRPKLKFFLENDGKNNVEKNSFKLFQAMTIGDTSDAASMHSIMTASGSKYKPKIFEILKKHSRQSCKLCQNFHGDLKFINKNLEDKYTTSLEFYNVKLINDIMYNEKVRIVSLFKDYLHFDDHTEFLKRSYTFPEAIIRLSKIFEFYGIYTQVLPNYIALSDRKHMYKNIERKQRLMDTESYSSNTESTIFEESKNTKRSKGPKKNVCLKIFNSGFMESILRTQKKNYHKMNLEGLVDSFNRHSVSHNELSSFLNESNYSIFSKIATKNMSPQKSAVDLLAQEHKHIHNQNKQKARLGKVEDKDSQLKKLPTKKVNLVGYSQKTLESKKRDKPLRKFKVEIDLPVQDETQLKYSLITNSSDGQKIIYLKKKETSKERSIDPEDAISKYAEDGDLTHNMKKTKKAPVKNARAFLTATFPKESKYENYKNKGSGIGTTGSLQRFSSASSKGNENILEIETLKSTSKESRSKKVGIKKKCKKKSNLVNYLGKTQTAKMKSQARVYKSTDKSEVTRPYTVQDYVIKPPS